MARTAASPQPADLLIRALNLLVELKPGDLAALRALPLRLATCQRDEDIIRQGDRPTQCCLLLRGFLCRYKSLSAGQRQILSFHLPGDVPDLQGLYLDVMDHALLSIVASDVAFIPHEAIHEMLRERPTLTAAFWKHTLVDASIFREWLAGIGRRSALQRMAHVLCEVLFRMRVLGVAEGTRMHLPLTQAELGDALGVSAVHVNRLLQELRGDSLLTVNGRTTVVEDWPRLRALADFDPSYLHLRAPTMAPPDLLAP